jgi:hypothetical protein
MANDTESKSKYVPTRIIDKLMEGSYENLLQKVRYAVENNRTKFGLKEDKIVGKEVFILDRRGRITGIVSSDEDGRIYEADLLDNNKQVIESITCDNSSIVTEVDIDVKKGKHKGKIIKVNLGIFGTPVAYDVKMLDGPSKDKIVSMSADSLEGSGDIEIEFTEGFAKPIATFKDYVVVANSDGKFYRARFSCSDNSVEFNEVADANIAVYEEDSNEVINSAVEGLIEGDDSLFKDNMRKLIRSVPDKESILIESFDRVVSSLKKVFPTNKKWKEFLRDNKETVAKVLYGDIGKIKEESLKSKYRHLYSKNISDEKLAEASQTIEQDIDNLVSRVNNLKENISKYHDEYQKRDHVFRDLKSDKAIKEFNIFIKDLKDDLADLSNGIKEVVIESDGCIPCLGLVFDEFAKNLVDYELATKLVSKALEKNS